MKRIYALLTVLALTFAIAAGCGGEPTATSKPDLSIEMATKEAAVMATASALARAAEATPTPTAMPRPTDTPRRLPTPTSRLMDTPRPTNTPLPPATATPPAGRANVQITFIFFSGAVPRTESDEYVEIINQGSAAQDMTGWRLVSLEGNQVFHFPPGFVMQPGQVCRVYTNEIHPETCGLSFGSGRAVWNNEGDAAALYDVAGNEVSRYSY